MVKKLLRSKKANALAWLIALVLVFVIGLVYAVMTHPFTMIYDKLYPNVTANPSEAAYTPTFDKISNVWKIWPILVILGVIIWAIVETVNRNRGYQY